MSSLARASQIKEITIDGNPITLNTDYISFLVSYLPNLQLLSTMQINEQIRRTAMAWRLSKEQSNSAFLDLGTQVCMNLRREEAISNAKTKWELLRSGARVPSAIGGGGGGSNKTATNDNRGNVLHARQNSTKFTQVACSLERAKTKAFGSLTSINENVEARKIHIKKRSNSSDNLFRSEDTSRLYPLEFKLPPILDSIVNNLTSAKVDDSLSSDDKGNSFCKARAHDDTEATSDSESDNSESHESLKTGLRDHLLFTASNSCGSSLDFLAKSTVRRKFTTAKNCATDNTTTRVQADARDSPPPPLSLSLSLSLPPTKWSERKMVMGENKTDVIDDDDDDDDDDDRSSTRKASRNRDGQSDCHSRSTVSSSGYCSLSSKTSSLDSCKSLLSDSSTSSIPKSAIDRKRCHDHEKDKGRIKSAQTKRLVHYKSNRAATARAKFRALAPQSPPLRPAKIPLKEREQGRHTLGGNLMFYMYMRLHPYIIM